jgi:glycosyltransferase involved in cell wall biosynthesis
MKKENLSPKVSVIIPTFNRVKYVCAAIENVRAQSYGNMEIIVIDDGSTDETKNILTRDYSDKIIYILQKNSGNSLARNNGLGHATGKYVAFLDDDDLWEVEKTAKQVEYLEEHSDIGFIYCGASYINENNKIIGHRIPWDDEVQTFNQLFKRNMILSPSLVMVKKECLDVVGNFDETLIQSSDYDLFLRLAKKFYFRHAPEKLCRYRVHDQNMSKNLERRLKSHMIIFKKKEITGEMSWFFLINRIACDYYTIAQFYLEDKVFVKAGYAFLRAIIHNPFVGINFWPKEAKKIRCSFLYRIVKSYGLLLYCLFNISSCKKEVATDG